LGREERCVELALGRGEGAVYGEGSCCAASMNEVSGVVCKKKNGVWGEIGSQMSEA
jgi:hypothetical protein